MSGPNLRAEHLPLLRAMAAKGRQVMREVYGVQDESLRYGLVDIARHVITGMLNLVP